MSLFTIDPPPFLFFLLVCWHEAKTDQRQCLIPWSHFTFPFIDLEVMQVGTVRGSLKSLCVHLWVHACVNMHVSLAEWVCVEKELDKSTDGGTFSRAAQMLLSLWIEFQRGQNLCSQGCMKFLWDHVFAIVPWCARVRACVYVRSGCLYPLPSGLLPVTHVLPIQVTNALGWGWGVIYSL